MEQKKGSIIVKNKRNCIILIIIIVFVLLLLGALLFRKSGKISSGRCSTDEYKISSSILNKVEKSIKEINEVDSVEVDKNVCIIKIVVNLKSDIDVNVLKSKMSEVLTIFGDEITSEFDISLFVSSNDDKSKTYPLNVSKHKSREDFAW